uniref:Circadian associated repressor of transcription a n=1 Tax=Esox lucius TaxID=8010 RepID=A0AAY5KVX6_ESOLU
GGGGGVERERQREMEDVQVKGDLLFAQKCAELQGFVRPLLELLNGLKGGRFDRGLSSFQQSVAIDRIQRIVGILRRPSIGEKYMNTLLQVEMMLKMWFPQVSPLAPQPAKPTGPAATTSTRDTPKCPHLHKHTDQSHIPVKVRTHTHTHRKNHKKLLITSMSRLITSFLSPEGQSSHAGQLNLLYHTHQQPAAKPAPVSRLPKPAYCWKKGDKDIKDLSGEGPVSSNHSKAFEKGGAQEQA